MASSALIAPELENGRSSPVARGRLKRERVESEESMVAMSDGGLWLWQLRKDLRWLLPRVKISTRKSRIMIGKRKPRSIALPRVKGVPTDYVTFLSRLIILMT